MDGSNPPPCGEISLSDLEEEITELAGHLNAANYRWLTLIAEFDRRQGWLDGRLHSCAHWLNFKCGLNLGAAREKVRVAHALTGLPKISASMARGELSYSKVRALTRVATEATEETFLMIALHGTAYHVENVVRHFRQAQEAEELSREARQQSTRTLDYWYDTDGSLVLKARLPALAGAMVVKALEAALASAPEADSSADFAEEHPASIQCRRADALAQIAEGYLQAPAQSITADRHQVVVHVDADCLIDRRAGRCHLEDGPSLSIETARRIACDASLVRITESAGAILDVGRKTRAIPPAIRRALNARDAGCCFPGCTFKRHLDAHHVDHWADGGKTNLANLVSLCRNHHRSVHEGGIVIKPRAGGGWRFFRPDGREFDSGGIEPAAPYEWTALHHTHAAAGLQITSDTAACRWRGERMDLGLAVSVLCERAAATPGCRGQHVPAETPISA
jgi:hypothetical protein